MSTEIEQDNHTELAEPTERTVQPYVQALISRHLSGRLPEADRAAVLEIIGCDHPRSENGAGECDCREKEAAVLQMVGRIKPGIECLQFLLQLVLVDRKTGAYDTVAMLYRGRGRLARNLFAEHGLRLVDDAAGSLIIANQNTQLRNLMIGSRWFRRGWRHDLARLPGAQVMKPMNFRGRVSRALLIPGDLLPKL